MGMASLCGETSSYFPSLKVYTIEGITIDVKDMQQVENNEWINDNIVDMYIWFLRDMRTRDYFFMCSHFYKVLSRDLVKASNEWHRREKILV